MPGRHGVQGAPACAVNVPAEQDVQATCPVKAFVEVPMGHGRHDPFWPGTGLYVPAGHRTQTCCRPFA